MRMLDVLSKLGILRVGAKAAVYKSGRDRPIEFMSDGVFNAERDLTTPDDVQRAVRPNSAAEPRPKA